MRILLEAFFLIIKRQMPINIRFQKTFQIDSCSILIYFYMNRCTLLNTSCSKYTFIFIFELRLRVLDTPFDDSMSQYDDFKLL